MDSSNNSTAETNSLQEKRSCKPRKAALKCKKVLKKMFKKQKRRSRRATRTVNNSSSALEGNDPEYYENMVFNPLNNIIGYNVLANGKINEREPNNIHDSDQDDLSIEVIDEIEIENNDQQYEEDINTLPFLEFEHVMLIERFLRELFTEQQNVDVEHSIDEINIENESMNHSENRVTMNQRKYTLEEIAYYSKETDIDEIRKLNSGVVVLEPMIFNTEMKSVSGVHW